jgi:hypothetical protein
MGHAMDSVAGCDILRDNPKLEFHEGDYSYTISRDDNRSIYTRSAQIRRKVNVRIVCIPCGQKYRTR